MDVFGEELVHILEDVDSPGQGEAIRPSLYDQHAFVYALTAAKRGLESLVRSPTRLTI